MPNYSAVIVTFQRPASLDGVLRGLLAQTLPPSLVVVADNDPRRSAESVVEQFQSSDKTQVSYIPLDANLGPAGGWARAATFVATHSRRGDWLMVVDDDDPIGSPAVAEGLLAAAAVAPPDVAAIGLRGARWKQWSASLERVLAEPRLPRPVDYLASSGAPMYRWTALDRVGFFDESLFFGFEDLDLGLRLERSGMQLQVVALETPHDVLDSSTIRSPWREYFKTRALVTIVQRHLGWWALVVTVLRSVMLGGLVLAIRLRRIDTTLARWRGCSDAFHGRLGATRYVPTTNPPKGGS